MKKPDCINNNVADIVLAVVGVAGIFAVAAVAPNCLQLLKFVPGSKWGHQKKYYVNKVLERLINQGLITLSADSSGVKRARLSAKGQEKLKRYELSELKISVPRKWDNKYRLVIFDIKEWKRGIRDDVRSWLEHLGFVRLQNSVWVYPYECQKVVVLLKSHFKIGKEVLYLTVESIENDHWLKEEFG